MQDFYTLTALGTSALKAFFVCLVVWKATSRVLLALERLPSVQLRARRAALANPVTEKANVLTLCVMAAILSMPYTLIVSDLDDSDTRDIVFGILAAVIVFIVVLLHRLPGSSRELKYVLTIVFLYLHGKL